MRNVVLVGLCITLVVVATAMWLHHRGPMVPAAVDAALPVGKDATAVCPPARSPADTVALLQTLHRQRAYDRIAPLIVADQRAVSLALLRAIDQVLDANESLRRMAEEAYSGPVTETWSLAAMADNLGPFSENVRRISQQFKGDTAIVTLQAGDNIPLIHAQFVLSGPQWQYRPEPSPNRLTTELLALTGILRSVEESVRYGAPFDSYLDSFLYRVLPQMARVVTAKDEGGGAVAVAEDE